MLENDLDKALAQIEEVMGVLYDPYRLDDRSSCLADIMFFGSRAWRGEGRKLALASTAALAVLWVARLKYPTAKPRVLRNKARHVLQEDVTAEYRRAHLKRYGYTPFSRLVEDYDKFAILGEEIGEVARALTPDATTPTGHAGDLVEELVQVATMAAAWLAREIVEFEARWA